MKQKWMRASRRWDHQGWADEEAQQSCDYLGTLETEDAILERMGAEKESGSGELSQLRWRRWMWGQEKV